jgi:hypothetical protein
MLFLLLSHSSLLTASAVILCAGEGGCHEIMWDVIRQGRKLLSSQRPSREECRVLEVTAMLFENTVVTPWYRTMADQVGNLTVGKS